ncbi:hypothetical protein C3477_04315, partial [Mycobacterium kansasii]
MNATDSTGTPSPRVLISRGLVFDGGGAAGVVRDIAIADGVVINVSAQQLNPGSFDEVIDAAGKWVMPGFLETHSHYDAETEPGIQGCTRG